ncbi:hypothetical protein ACN47E_000918 [Coniothyrium glycines]
MRPTRFPALGCMLGISLVSATSVPRDVSSALTVDLGYGIYQGVHNTTAGLNVWKGIRYASPPLGDLRWQAPVLPAPSRNATIHATAFGPSCPQAPPAPQNSSTLGDEDCLFLNVYAPQSEPGRQLPVLVWIHGGGYGAGNGQQDMRAIINDNDNAFVAVTIQYRLGAFGFLSSAQVAADGVANAGILDQAFALQWVQDHIGQFGGDARRVTISGESAGAGSVMLLSTAKSGTLGTSLFQNAIAASPYLPPQYDYNASVPTQRFQDFASRAGCSNTTDTLVCLRGKDSEILQAANAAANSVAFYGNWAFLPVTDYDFVATLSSVALEKKQVNGEHILVGNNADEGSLFVPPGINSTNALKTWLQGNFPSLNTTVIQHIVDAYASNSTDSTAKFATSGFGPANALTTSPVATGIQQTAYNIYAEATFVCPSYWLSGAFTTAHRTAHHYQYSIPVALHAADVSGYFGPATPNQPPVFTDAFRHIWGAQIERGTPAAALTNLTWPTWVEGETSQMLNLNTTGGVEFQATLSTGVNATEYREPGLRNAFSTVNAWSWEAGRGERCAFWREIASLVPI